MTDVTTLLAGIKTLEEAASDGPWYFEVGSGNVIREYVTDDGNEEADLVGNVEGSSDGPFIAAARTDVPRLMAALEAVEDLAKRLRDNRPGDPDSAFDRGYAMGRRAAGDLVSNIISAALGGGE